jgi:hypothetical protein
MKHHPLGKSADKRQPVFKFGSWFLPQYERDGYSVSESAQLCGVFDLAMLMPV